MTRFLDDALAYAAREWSILPVGADKKPAIRKWKRWQSEPADEKQLRKWFNKVGLHGMAVVCGPVSGGLVVRDFDTMDAYNRWAREHIELAGQLPTVATARGRHVYFRNSLDRIITVESNGEHEGELRGAGYVLLPPSRHPSGATYRWTVALPEGPIRHVEDPAAAGLVSAGLLQLQAAPVQQREQRQQRQTEITQDMACGGEGENGRLIQDIIGATQPRTVGQRNRAVFELARALKAVPTLHDADPRELQAIVVEWHKQALPVIDTKAFEETWIDFLQAWPKVKYPLGTEPMHDILERAKSAPPPTEAMGYEHDKLRLLVSMCRELQRHAGDGPFYLGCRTAGRLLDVNHTTAWRWLFLLESDGLLSVVERGGQTGSRYRATRYRYGRDLPRA